jgi:acyl-CoA reductase-like NAD-dependent aldehyde dehydrogenase
VVLIVGPANYPIFLPGVQMLQALVAGNAVLLKPGRDGRDAARHMAGILQECGLDSRLLSILPESPAAAREAIQLGVDKVFLTGSADTGQAILQELGPKLTPAVLELSGCDAVFVQEDADLELVVKALSFGLRLNGGATCIAPRRVFVHQCQAAGLEQRLRETVHRLPPVWVDHRASELACRLAAAAVAEGARLLTGSLTLEERMRPLLLADARGSMALLQADLFAPVLTIVPVPDDEAALAEARLCPYALGAAVFGPVNPARALARRIRAGCVVINDMIVPTADPRLPFGGRGRSGFGVTRGLEGLREMTTVKVIAIRRSRWLPHLDQPREGDGELLRDYLAAVHGGSIALRVRAVARLIRVLWRRWVTV